MEEKLFFKFGTVIIYVKLIQAFCIEGVQNLENLHYSSDSSQNSKEIRSKKSTERTNCVQYLCKSFLYGLKRNRHNNEFLYKNVSKHEVLLQITFYICIK